MKKLILVLFLASPLPALAGPIMAGGPRINLYRAVCYIRTAPNELPPYQVFVGFRNLKGLNEVEIYADLDRTPRVVEHLMARQIFTLQRGTNENYVAKHFSLSIQSDECSQNGGKSCGKFSGTIAGEEISGGAECQLFDEN